MAKVPNSVFAKSQKIAAKKEVRKMVEDHENFDPSILAVVKPDAQGIRFMTPALLGKPREEGEIDLHALFCEKLVANKLVPVFSRYLPQEIATANAQRQRQLLNTALHRLLVAVSRPDAEVGSMHPLRVSNVCDLIDKFLTQNVDLTDHEMWLYGVNECILYIISSYVQSKDERVLQDLNVFNPGCWDIGSCLTVTGHGSAAVTQEEQSEASA